MTTFGELQGTASVRIPGANAGYTIEWAARTDVGLRRPVNEDSLVVIPPVFAVADGMGGHSAGDVASDAVGRHLSEVGRSGAATPDAIELALAAAQTDLDRRRAESLLGSGTTVTGVAVVEAEGRPSWLTFNIGDSRVYRWSAGRLTQVTSDHSVVQEMVKAGLITAEQAESHPDNNIITRAVGFEDSPVPDYGVVPITDGDRIVVCSDGLSKELSDTDLARLVGEKVPVATVVERLVTTALDHGGRDNVTVIVAEVSATE